MDKNLSIEFNTANNSNIGMVKADDTPADVESCLKEEQDQPNNIISCVSKLKAGMQKKSPSRASLSEIIASCCLSFIGILLVGSVGYWYLQNITIDGTVAIPLLSGAYGATAVLLYNSWDANFSQPRNVMGSYLVTSLVGVATRIICGQIGIPQWITGAFAVSIAIGFMNLTKTVHPPGGACALIAVIGGDSIEKLGFSYVLTSIGAAFLMVSIAIIGNNIIPSRQYPTYWW